MASTTQETSVPPAITEEMLAAGREESPGGATSPDRWYDRSSIRFDAMVTIEGQSPGDYERLAPENAFCEYLDGVVYMPSPATDRHQNLSGFFFNILDSMSCVRPIGEVMQGPAVLRVGEQRKLEPDVFVRQPGPRPAGEPPALLVIEILSPSTRHVDLGKKLTVYRDAGIPEIWLVDELGRERAVIVERKVGEGYRRESYAEGRLEASAIPGFWIDVSWLWQHPLPSRPGCLAMILGEEPPAGPNPAAD